MAGSLAVCACGGSDAYTPAGTISSAGALRFGARRLTKGTVIRELTVLSVRIPSENRSTEEALDAIERVLEERDGVAEALRVALRTGTITRRGTVEVDLPSVVSGKTYDVVRRGLNVEFTMADGGEVPVMESEYLRQVFARLGGLRPMAAALRGRAWRVGDVGERLVAPLKEEIASKLTLGDAVIRLESFRRDNGADHVVFNVKGHARIPRSLEGSFPIEGELETALDDAGVTRIELHGRVRGGKSDGPWSEVLYRYLRQR
jgi:hypothetical protein